MDDIKQYLLNKQVELYEQSLQIHGAMALVNDLLADLFPENNKGEGLSPSPDIDDNEGIAVDELIEEIKGQKVKDTEIVEATNESEVS